MHIENTHAIHDGTTYFDAAISYTHKVLMKLAPGVHFIIILCFLTYGCSKINQSILKTLDGSIHAMDDITTYFARAVSYKHKMFMKLAPGDQFISIL